jgi:hypothetical protein
VTEHDEITKTPSLRDGLVHRGTLPTLPLGPERALIGVKITQSSIVAGESAWTAQITSNKIIRAG